MMSSLQTQTVLVLGPPHLGLNGLVPSELTVIGGNADASRTLLVTHGITCGSNPTQWWKSFLPNADTVPPGWRVVCVASFGSDAGAFGPKQFALGGPAPGSFPRFTIADTVDVLVQSLHAIGIHTIDWAVGGSFGGFQLLDLLARYPGTCAKADIFAACPLEGNYAVLNLIERRILEYAHSEGRMHLDENSLRFCLQVARMIGSWSYAYPAACERDVSPKDAFQAMLKKADDFTSRFSVVGLLRLLECFGEWKIEVDGLASGWRDCTLHSFTGDLLTPSASIEHFSRMLSHSGWAASHIAHELVGHHTWLTDQILIPRLLMEKWRAM